MRKPFAVQYNNSPWSLANPGLGSPLEEGRLRLWLLAGREHLRLVADPPGQRTSSPGKVKGDHDSGRNEHISVVAGFWGKGVPAPLSKIRNENLTRRSSCRQ